MSEPRDLPAEARRFAAMPENFVARDLLLELAAEIERLRGCILEIAEAADGETTALRAALAIKEKDYEEMVSALKEAVREISRRRPPR